MRKNNREIKESLAQKRLKAFLDSTPGIVHNLSNPLTIISTYSQLMQMQEPDNTNITKMVEQSKLIENILNNIVYISQNILKEKPQQININTFLKNEIEYFRANPLFKHKVITTLDLTDKIPVVVNSYFHLSTLLFTIIQLTLYFFQSSEEKRIYISTKKKTNSVVISITVSVDDITNIINENEYKPLIEAFNDALIISQEVDISTKINRKNTGTEFVIEIPDKT
ncbi:MAG: hypothetical protein DRP96_06060 [Candidatus Neomarinimicrobiota bacterium]|nr:MAG: hypothetical protein DRP96_06060 [Candidatus Neomarinimicrobiota bacterium]